MALVALIASSIRLGAMSANATPKQLAHLTDFGQSLGLTKDWASRAVRAVGNYGEMFETNLGARSRYAIPRGLNQLWEDGGILYAPPLQ